MPAFAFSRRNKRKGVVISALIGILGGDGSKGQAIVTLALIDSFELFRPSPPLPSTLISVPSLYFRNLNLERGWICKGFLLGNKCGSNRCEEYSILEHSFYEFFLQNTLVYLCVVNTNFVFYYFALLYSFFSFFFFF